MNLTVLRYGVSLILTIVLLLSLNPLTLAEKPALDTDLKTVPQGSTSENQVNSSQFTPLELNKKTPPANLDEFRPILSGQVSESQYLPESFYGTWEVTGNLISTNAPKRFRQTTHDIWTLQQMGTKIRLANPNTNSDSFITVNEVVNNTATFTCKSTLERKFFQMERVTITVTGDQFNGQSIMLIQYYKKRTLIGVEQALFSLSAKKLSGPTPQIFR